MPVSGEAAFGVASVRNHSFLSSGIIPQLFRTIGLNIKRGNEHQALAFDVMDWTQQKMRGNQKSSPFLLNRLKAFNQQCLVVCNLPSMCCGMFRVGS